MSNIKVLECNYKGEFENAVEGHLISGWEISSTDCSVASSSQPDESENGGKGTLTHTSFKYVAILTRRKN